MPESVPVEDSDPLDDAYLAGFQEGSDSHGPRLVQAEAKLAAIRELCDAYDFDTDNIEPAQIRAILDGIGSATGHA